MSVSTEVSCWCMRTSVLVPVEWVSEGRTSACPDPGCYPGCPVHDTDAFDSDDEDAVVAATPRKKVKMNRYSPERYDPAGDSSEGVPVTVRSAHPGDLILAIGPGQCQCGCGETPRGKNARFGMGHDIRLRGKLIRAQAADALVVVVSGGTSAFSIETYDPLTFASRYSTPKLDWAESVRDGASKVAVRTARRKAAANPEREVLAAAADVPEGRTLVRVGRWDHTGRIVAIYRDSNGVLYDYVGRDDKRHFARRVDGEIREVEAAS